MRRRLWPPAGIPRSRTWCRRSCRCGAASWWHWCRRLPPPPGCRRWRTCICHTGCDCTWSTRSGPWPERWRTDSVYRIYCRMTLPYSLHADRRSGSLRNRRGWCRRRWSACPACPGTAARSDRLPHSRWRNRIPRSSPGWWRRRRWAAAAAGLPSGRSGPSSPHAAAWLPQRRRPDRPYGRRSGPCLWWSGIRRHPARWWSAARRWLRCSSGSCWQRILPSWIRRTVSGWPGKWRLRCYWWSSSAFWNP